MSEIKVSVCVITYNHADYIEQCLDSILDQNLTHDFEIIIGEDMSTDNTLNICRTYAAKYPDVIRVVSGPKNLGIVGNWVRIFTECRGEYIAVCEGDDYWTNPLKLQEQISILDENPSYSMVSHNAKIIYEDGQTPPALFSKSPSKILNIEVIIKKWSIPTASMVFRRRDITYLPTWIDDIYSIDFTLALLLSSKGKIWFDSKVMSVYRVNYTGTSASATLGKNFQFVAKQHIKLLNYFDSETNYQYGVPISARIKEINKDLKFFGLRSKSILLSIFYMPSYALNKCWNKVVKVING